MPRLLRLLDPRYSLATAVGWLVIAMSLAFALIATLWLGGMARTTLLQQHGQQLALTTDQWATELDQALASRLQLVRATAIILGAELDSEKPRAWRAVLDDVQSAYPELEWIGLADPQGKIVAASAGQLEGAHVAEQPWFAQGLKGPWIGEAHDFVTLNKKRPGLSNGQQRLFIDITTPVRNPQGHTIGVLGAHLSLRWIQNHTQGLRATIHLHDGAEALVLDKTGVVLIGPSSLQDKRWHSVPDKQTIFDTTPTILNNNHQTAAPTLEHMDNGQILLVAHAEPRAGSALHALGWHTQIIEPVDKAYLRANSLWLQILWVSLAVGGSTALLGALIVRQLMQRLTRLTHSVDAMGSDQAQRVEVPSGIDEIARVGTAFANVLDVLQTERSELRTLSAELEQRVAVRTREVERLAAETRYAVVVRERLKLARDLHDTLAHSMMAMLTEVRLLRKLHLHDPASLPEELDHAEQAAHQGLKEARAAITQLRFNAVRDIGLGAALADAIKLFSERTGLVVDYTSDPGAASFADERAETLFRIVEEALRNVERHATASRVWVHLSDVAGGRLVLSIDDDGVGFDPDSPRPGHYGLVGLREQAQLIGAELSIQSVPHEGTRLRLSLRMQLHLRL